MPEVKIIPPSIENEQKIKKLINVAEVLTRLTGLTFEYVGTNEDGRELKDENI